MRESKQLSGYCWPIPAHHHFPKADIRAADFGKRGPFHKYRSGNKTGTQDARKLFQDLIGDVSVAAIPLRNPVD